MTRVMSQHSPTHPTELQWHAASTLLETSTPLHLHTHTHPPTLTTPTTHPLCPGRVQDGALALLEGLAPRYGIKPEARHVAVVVGGLARAGNFDDASSLLDAAGNRGWGRSAGVWVCVWGC